MQLKKLEELFYEENKHLVEVLDKDRDGNWDGNKTRGYGIAVCEHKGLRFGIPLRTKIKHDCCFKTKDDKGLDYSKAVLLLKDSYISKNPFVIPQEEHVKILDKSHHIQKMFSKYVEIYVKGHQKNDANILRYYRYSTLQNYHAELGIVVVVSDVISHQNL